LELRHLQALVCVAERASFTKAADDLSLTQSAVTRQIAALELETKARLFDRLGRQVVLTAAGVVLHEYAVEMLRLDSEAAHAVADVVVGAAGKLAVGASSTAAAYLLPSLLQEFRLVHPAVTLSVLTGPSQRVAEQVSINQVDVGLVMDDPNLGGLTAIKLADYSIALIVYPDHALMRRGQEHDSVSLEELARLPLILMQKGGGLRNSADIILRQAGPDLNISMELDNVEAIKKMTEAKLGVSLLPIMSVENEIASGTLIALPVVSPSPPCPSIVLIHRQDKYVTAIMKSFIGVASEHLRSSG
jgi:DNA-binding transcriptional LysR family regulator